MKDWGHNAVALPGGPAALRGTDSRCHLRASWAAAFGATIVSANLSAPASQRLMFQSQIGASLALRPEQGPAYFGLCFSICGVGTSGFGEGHIETGLDSYLLAPPHRLQG